MVLLEAMDAGVPIVSTRVGGVPDVVGPEHAFLVAPGDPGALREGILDATRRAEEAGRRATRASARLDDVFGADGWLAVHEDVYREAQATYALRVQR